MGGKWFSEVYKGVGLDRTTRVQGLLVLFLRVNPSGWGKGSEFTLRMKHLIWPRQTMLRGGEVPPTSLVG